MGDMNLIITLKDIAKKANVSITTVSKVLNNRESNIKISDSTKKKIKKIAKELNYHPNLNARALVLNETKTIGLLLNKTLDPFFTDLVIGVEEQAKEEGYRILLSTTNSEPVEKTVETLFNQKVVDGVLIGASGNIGDENKFLDYINNYKLPVVLVTNSLGNLPSVQVDSYLGAYLATEHLIKSGRIKIAFIARSENKMTLDFKKRLAGFKDCINTYNLAIKEEYIQYGELSYKSGYLKTQKLLELNDSPDAIFASEDRLALGALRAASERNVKVPKDLAIIGFDNITQTEYSIPKLSTIAQPKEEIGKKATEILLHIIKGEEIKDCNIVFKPELIIRESC